MNPKQDAPITAEYLKVKAYGEHWNGKQKLKRYDQGNYAEQLLYELDKKIDQ